MAEAEAEQVLESAPFCTFNRSPETHPILWTRGADGPGAMKLNGVIIPLQAQTETDAPGGTWRADGLSMRVAPLPEEEMDWRSNTELVFTLEQGLSAGYRGFWSCATGEGEPQISAAEPGPARPADQEARRWPLLTRAR